MEDNPYSAFVGFMRENAAETIPAAYRISTVITSEPLTVDVSGNVQDKTSLILIASPSVSVTVDNYTDGYAVHDHTARVNRETPEYVKGDRLLLIPIEDEQRYIVLGRLIGL